MTEQLFRIKPLVWQYFPGRAVHQSNTICGGYYVDRWGKRYTVYTPPGISRGEDFDTLKEAKAAAEADFKTRLMAHLEEVK